LACHGIFVPYTCHSYKKNKKKIFGVILIGFGTVALLYAISFGLGWFFALTYSSQTAGTLLVWAALLGISSIILLLFGDKLLRKGRKEEKEKQEGK